MPRFDVNAPRGSCSTPAASGRLTLDGGRKTCSRFRIEVGEDLRDHHRILGKASGRTAGACSCTPDFKPFRDIVDRLGKESDITPLVTFLALPESQWVTGQTPWVNGGHLTR